MQQLEAHMLRMRTDPTLLLRQAEARRAQAQRTRTGFVLGVVLSAGAAGALGWSMFKLEALDARLAVAGALVAWALTVGVMWWLRALPKDWTRAAERLAKRR